PAAPPAHPRPASLQPTLLGPLRLPRRRHPPPHRRGPQPPLDPALPPGPEGPLLRRHQLRYLHRFADRSPPPPARPRQEPPRRLADRRLGVDGLRRFPHPLVLAGPSRQSAR